MAAKKVQTRRNRTHTVGVKMTDLERGRLYALAEFRGQNMSETVRDLVNEAIGKNEGKF